MLQLFDQEGQRWRTATKEKNTTAKVVIKENVKQTVMLKSLKREDRQKPKNHRLYVAFKERVF